MIRREFQGPDGRTCWALVSQVEHARLSGEMAAAWGSAACPRLDFADELLPAIEHHDDGWSQWEQQPGVDPASGRPLNFTEMPLGESLDIWRRSISAAAQFGPLAGYMVSGHFAALLRHQNAWQKMGSPHQDQARAYLDEQDQLRTDWLARWQRESPDERTPAAAETGLHWLQFFDALSLWLCMAQRVEPHTMPLPGGGQLRLEPLSVIHPHSERIELAPWPFATPALPMGLSARGVPVEQYRTAAELADAPAATVVLNWLLIPASGSGTAAESP